MLQLPGNGREVGGHAAVRDRRDLRRETVRERFRVRTVRGERLGHETRGIAVLGSRCKMRVEDRWRLPVKDLQVIARATLPTLSGPFGLTRTMQGLPTDTLTGSVYARCTAELEGHDTILRSNLE